MEEEQQRAARRLRRARVRTAGAMAAALAFSLGIYLLIESIRPESGLISYSFLLVLPAAISAFVAYVGDPLCERSRGYYRRIPVWILAFVMLFSVILLREGSVCILILSPLWLISGLTGAEIAYLTRRRDGSDGTVHCSAAILLPLMAMQVEPYIPLPEAEAVVRRSTIVNASPETLWPLLRGVPDVRPDEGRWNFTQDVIGVPRPLGARLVGEGMGADRLARWGRDVQFRERIIAWRPGVRIGWRFLFDRIDGWRFTDRHLMPNSPYFRVTTGGYTLERLGPARTRVTIDTRYWMKTPVNAYSALWGELFLGDLENNLLALIKGRAERVPVAPPSR